MWHFATSLLTRKELRCARRLAGFRDPDASRPPQLGVFRSRPLVDFDSDSEQDLYAVMGDSQAGDGFHNVLLENAGRGHHWLGLDVVGVAANRAAIGARIRVTVAAGDGELTIHATVGSAGSFGVGCYTSAGGMAGDQTTRCESA